MEPGGPGGFPEFAGAGDLSDGSPNSLYLREAHSGLFMPTAAGLFIGVDPSTPAPFKQGTLVPVPVLELIFVPTSPGGTITIGFDWPSGVPSGFNLYLQWGWPNINAPAGVGLSKALRGTTP